jgi:type I restriction enzyme, S subunit
MTFEWGFEKLGDLTINFDAKRKPVKEVDRKRGPHPYYGASGIVDYVDGYLFEGEHLLIAEDGENLRTDISAYLTGAVMPKLTQGNLNRMEVPCPPIETQNSIVAVLGSLDDRITLLRETNTTLEAIAQALFKSWFIDFDPVRAKSEGRLPEGMDEATAALFPNAFEETELGMVPKGWVISRLIDFAKLKGGKMLSKEYFSVDGEFPVYGGAGEMGRSNLSNAEGFVITVGRVGAYCGQYFWHMGKAWVNNNASHVIPQDVNYSVWLYQWLRSVDMDLIKKGAAQPFVSNGDIENLQIILPATSLIEEFVNVCKPLFERMSTGVASISVLTNLRDTLLPRLISGQLRITEAQEEFQKVVA